MQFSIRKNKLENSVAAIDCWASAKTKGRSLKRAQDWERKKMDEKWQNGNAAELAEFIVCFTASTSILRHRQRFCFRLFCHFGHNTHSFPCIAVRNVSSIASSIVVVVGGGGRRKQRHPLPSIHSWIVHTLLNITSKAEGTFRTPEYLLGVRMCTKQTHIQWNNSAEVDNPSEDLAF